MCQLPSPHSISQLLLSLSLFEWFHPLYLQDKANGFKTSRYVDEVMMPQIKRLVTEYEPDIVWSDGDWEATSDYWKSTEFLAWLFNESKQRERVVVNDRWGNGCTLNHGGVYIGPDRYSPGKLQQHKVILIVTIIFADV